MNGPPLDGTQRAMRALGLVTFVLTLAASAGAQVHGPPPPATTSWVDLTRLGGDARSGFGTAGDTLDIFAMQPLRLGMLASAPPQPHDAFSLCRNASAPTDRALAFRLVGPSPSWSERRALGAPRLTLFGMSRDGCAIDAAAGGGATFTVGITQNTFFVLSAGAIYLPQSAEGPRAEKQLRAEIVVKGEQWPLVQLRRQLPRRRPAPLVQRRLVRHDLTLLVTHGTIATCFPFVIRRKAGRWPLRRRSGTRSTTPLAMPSLRRCRGK